MKKFTQISGVIGKSKKFNQELHNKFDSNAREIIKDKIPKYVIDNPNIYGEDLIINCNGLPYDFIEVQVCGTWIDKYPYIYPFIYARKMRFSDKTLFITFNADYTKIIMFSKKAIINKPVRMKKYGKEYIYYVDNNKYIEVSVNNFNLSLIKIYAGINVNSDSDSDSDNLTSNTFSKNVN